MGVRKQVKKFGGRPIEREPEPGKRVHLSLAVPQPLKQKIEKAAAARVWSISNEASHRLESTFDSDKSFGGADVRNMALYMATAFAMAGRRTAHAKGLGDDWVSDPECYLAAISGVLDALLRELPRGSVPDHVAGALKSVLLTWDAQRKDAGK